MSSVEILSKNLNSKPLLKIGGAFDAMSAKLVELNNFDGVWASSFAISATHALPDTSIMTMTEFLGVTKSMVDSCKLPVIADCDTGFGGTANVSHMVKKYEDAGVAAVCIEDQVFPKKNSLLENSHHELIAEKEFVSKIIAAKNAKKDPNFIIIARTEALIANVGMKEAIKRALAYEKAGADAILIHSKKQTADEIFEFSDSWGGDIPLVIVPTSYPSITLKQIQSHKIKMVIYANQCLRSAYASMSKILKQIISSNSLSDVSEPMSSMEEIFKLQEMYNIENQEKDIKEKLKKLGYIN